MKQDLIGKRTLRGLGALAAGALVVLLSADAGAFGESCRSRSRPVYRAGAPRLRVGLASRRVAGPLGLLALGPLRPELVTSPARCDRAHSVDPAKWTDLALYRGLRRRLGGRVRPRIPERGERRDQRQHSQA